MKKTNPFIKPIEATNTSSVSIVRVEEMPTVTSLLERKKLGPRTDSDGITRAAFPPGASPGYGNPKIIPLRAPRAAVAVTPLIRWEREQLEKNADPLAARVLAELQKGTRFVVFLSVSPQERASRDAAIPIFVAQAYACDAEDTRPILLEGMKWDPTLVPTIWNALRVDGRAEFAPPATQTDLSSERNAIRAAFAVQNDERLTLVRIDDGKHCRGVLTLYSTGS